MTSMILNRLVLQDFESAMLKAFWRDLFGRLTRKGNNLLSFDQVCQDQPLTGQHYRGLQAVPLDQIVGSEGHYRDFDRAFFPRQSQVKDRWLRINKAYHEKVPLPPVELFKVGRVYFVRDGNHRISVARAHGQEFIDAYVTEIDAPVSVEKADIAEPVCHKYGPDYRPAGMGGNHRL
jgi:hypothetical protein